MGEQNPRPFKGKSLLEFPANYTVIDAETTGFDPRWDEIIELAALRVRGGEVVAQFSTLVRPRYEIPTFVTQHTGISNDDVADAPPLRQALADFLEFIGSDVLVGHYVHFDVNFLYDAAASIYGRSVSNDMVDTMRLARHILPQLESHSLCDVAAALGVCQKAAHRALVDCETTHAVMVAMVKTGFDFTSLPKKKQMHHYKLKAADITAVEGKQQPDSPLFGKVCVFTGVLSIPRREAMQAVLDIGGICGDSVTKSTNFLILGNNDYCASIKGGKSRKQKKAEELILKGQDLRIISESVFMDMLLPF